MSSFACPHLNTDEYCIKLKKDCVPGRPGCVLSNKVVFAIPVTDRIKEKDEKRNQSKKLK